LSDARSRAIFDRQPTESDMSEDTKTIDLGAAEPEALAEYVRLLNVAYDNGEARGGSMEWSDVETALEKAVEAFGEAGTAFREANDEIQYADDSDLEDIDLLFVAGHEPSDAEMSAAKLMKAFVGGDHVKWEAVDEAWELVREAPAAAPAM
jgi:hypothetical protein